MPTGSVWLDGDIVIGIEEKLEVPKSSYAVTGVYMYDAKVFEVIRELKPSGQGELEITDVDNYYIDQGRMGYKVMEGCLLRYGDGCEFDEDGDKGGKVQEREYSSISFSTRINRINVLLYISVDCEAGSLPHKMPEIGSCHSIYPFFPCLFD